MDKSGCLLQLQQASPVPSGRYNMAPRWSERFSLSVRSLFRSFACVCLPLGCLILPAHQVPAAEKPVPNMTVRPAIGKPELFPEDQIKPGMKGVAWTVFQGNTPEAVPVEIIGISANMWGPRQDIIVAKLSGKAARTNVAGGMSGSPVYIEGKLVGAISLRLSVFSPDAVCGITPIRLMLELNDFDQTRPSDRKTPNSIEHTTAGADASVLNGVAAAAPVMTTIATPVTMSGFSEEAVRSFSPVFTQIGMPVAQGGVGGSLNSQKIAADWKTSLRPGDSVAAVMVSGDMAMTGAGTVTYNDGKRVLAFGHPLFNLGPVNMPLAKEEIVTTLASSYTPTKMGNPSEVVGALRQDRHSGIGGELGATSQMIPVTMHVRSYDSADKVRKSKDFHFGVFVDQKWTPYLMMATLFNSISNLNHFSEEATYRLRGQLQVEGQHRIDLNTMQAPAGTQIPTPMLLAGWWGDKFNRLYVNSNKLPKLDSVDVSVDLLPERRIAQIESAWISDNKVTPGTEVPVKVFLKPYKGDRLERTVNVRIPAGLTRGEHQILFSDGETLSRFQNIASSLNRIEDIPQTVALLNDERKNNRVYVSLIESQPTVYSDEKVLPSLPASVLNVMQSGRATNHQFVSSPESAHEQTSVPLDVVVTGNYSLKVFVN